MKEIIIGLRRNVLSFLSFPTAALAEGLGMFLSNMMFLLVWATLVSKSAIAGWGIREACLFLGTSFAVYGVISLLFMGLVTKIEDVALGNVDHIFLRPGSPLLHLATSDMKFSGLGDLTSGLLLLYFSSYPLPAIAFVFLVSLITVMSFLIFLNGVVMLLRAISWEAFGELFDIFLVQETWPVHAVKDPYYRFLFTVVIPGMLSIVVPIEIILGQSSPLLLLLLPLWLAFSLFVWREGLKRYEGLQG